MSNLPPNQTPVRNQQQISPQTEGASSIALWIEIIFGYFGVLGVGHVYTGRIALGIAMMVGWWIYIGVATFISTMTLGFLACLFGPIYIAVPIISGIQARTYMKQRSETGSWQSVAIVAGGGCLLIVIAIVLVLGIIGFGLFTAPTMNF